MMTGWYPPFKVDRGLTEEEICRHLGFDSVSGMAPDEGGSLVSFNSTYAEFVDKTFSMKGFAQTLVFFSIIVFSLILLVHSLIYILPPSPPIDSILAFALMAVVICGGGLILWNVFLKHDFFRYRYYPVRFNRKTQMVHFLIHNGPDGVVTMPWASKQLFFHIGHGTQNKELRDLRCHVLDRHRIVQGTYTVGIFTDSDRRVRERWEFIVRYMESGPDYCVTHPADKVITLSMANSLRNAYRWTCVLFGQSLFPYRHILFPVYWLVALNRWLVMATCRRPMFPADVESECRIAPDDQNRWAEPAYIGQFEERPEVAARTLERFRTRNRR